MVFSKSTLLSVWQNKSRPLHPGLHAPNPRTPWTRQNLNFPVSLFEITLLEVGQPVRADTTSGTQCDWLVCPRRSRYLDPLVTREGCQSFTPLFGKRLTKTKSRYQVDKEGIVWPMCDLKLAEVSHYSLVQASSTAHWAPSHAHSRLTSLLLGKRAVFNGESHPRKNSLDLDRFNKWIPDIENRSSTWSNEEILL